MLNTEKQKNVGKYVNSPESDIYSKSHELYGLYQAKSAIVKHERCFLVEGYTDVISMHQSGIEKCGGFVWYFTYGGTNPSVTPIYEQYNGAL